RDDARMAVPRRTDGDARGEIEEAITVDVLDHRPLAALDGQRIDPRVRRRGIALVVGDELLALGAGQIRVNPRHGQLVHSRGCWSTSNMDWRVHAISSLVHARSGLDSALVNPTPFGWAGKRSPHSRASTEPATCARPR